MASSIVSIAADALVDRRE